MARLESVAVGRDFFERFVQASKFSHVTVDLFVQFLQAFGPALFAASRCRAGQMSSSVADQLVVGLEARHLESAQVLQAPQAASSALDPLHQPALLAQNLTDKSVRLCMDRSLSVVELSAREPATEVDEATGVVELRSESGHVESR